MANNPKPRGRPSSYSQEKADEICELLSDGEALLKICEREDMPSRTSVWRWLEAHEEFRAKYARARETQAHVVAENAYLAGLSAGEIDPAAARVKMDAGKWYAGKLLGKVYGDKVQNEHSGPDGGPITLKWGDGTT